MNEITPSPGKAGQKSAGEVPVLSPAPDPASPSSLGPVPSTLLARAPENRCQKVPNGAKKCQTASSVGLAEATRRRMLELLETGASFGCSPDQLRNFCHAGILLQSRQVAASAAARMCDLPNGPTAVGYGGARGGGKTHWLLAQMGADDCQRVPGLKCLLLRKVGKSNLENFEGLRHRLFANLPHEFNVSRGILTFANGSRIVLGHYQCEKEIDSYLGLEYDIIGIEEATQLTARKYEDISTCCRTSRPDWRPRIYSTTNPGGIGHQWYLEKFIVPHQTRTETSTRFIPARVDDNAFVNPDYKDNLASRTGWQYDAWYLGKWDFPAGQFFKSFDPRVHVIGDEFKESIAEEWFASMDYGYTHRNVVLLGCRDYKDNIYIVGEVAERFMIPQVFATLAKAMFAQHLIYSGKDHLRDALRAEFPNNDAMQNRLWGCRSRRMLSRFVAGADMFANESSGNSVAAQYGTLGFHLRPANMDRVSGWSAILSRFGDPASGVAPTLFIHKRCKRLLETLPYLQHDPDRPGDILKTNVNEEGQGGDDAADALRYMIATKPNICRVVKLRGL